MTAPFVYARIMGTSDAAEAGYPEEALDHWARRACLWAAGKPADGLDAVGPHHGGEAGRDVFLYVISGFKAHNPAAAMAIIERLD